MRQEAINDDDTEDQDYGELKRQSVDQFVRELLCVCLVLYSYLLSSKL